MSLGEILKHIPAGCKVPAMFEFFVKAEPPCPIDWSGLTEFGLKETAGQQAVAFMRLGDGGVVALWYHEAEPAVVLIGSEGESDVLARNFEEFVQAVNAGKSGLLDFDRQSKKFVVPGILGKDPEESRRYRKSLTSGLMGRYLAPSPIRMMELRRNC